MFDTARTPTMFDAADISPAALLPQPEYRPVAGANAVELTKRYQFEGFDLPIGFRWDGATIPRLAWFFVGHPMAPRSMASSLIHDDLYQRGYYIDHRTGQKYPISRVRADAIFFDICKLYAGVDNARNKWERYKLLIPIYSKYVALRFGGWYAWNQYRSGNWDVPGDGDGG